jgi:hypothetical protein
MRVAGARFAALSGCSCYDQARDAFVSSKRRISTQGRAVSISLNACRPSPSKEPSREACKLPPAALAAAEASGTHWADAELHRLRGELLGRLPSADRTEIEGCFRTALTVAREQGSRGFELRGAVSLARLLSAQGRRDEARDILAPVYGWFTEGFGTPDLREAKALLDEPT